MPKAPNPKAILIPATFEMKRGGTIEAVIECYIEPADPYTGIMSRQLYMDGSAWIETKKGYRNVDWLFNQGTPTLHPERY